ncbi:MAG: hypothetical protein JW800_07690 [Candidatus Omnitrophica bacterium]|nr:hypothetical protein [Candidatus Omnitrophota bacterium]
MKKVSIIVQSKDDATALQALRSLGVLHVEDQNVPKGKDINSLREDIALVDGAIGILSTQDFSKKNPGRDINWLKDWKSVIRHTSDSWKRLDRVQEYASDLRGKIDEWGPWGEFDPGAIRGLAEKNIYVRLCKVHKRDLGKFPRGVVVKRLSFARGIINCAVISDEKVDIPFKEITLPEMGLKEMRERLSESESVIESAKEEIRNYAQYRENFINIKQALEKELRFHEAVRGMGQTGELKYLRGYVPQDAVDKLLKASKRENWGILVEDPSEEDKVPTLIRNPRWVSIIEPVFKVLGILPGYKELDISLWFLLFFSVFFGMLIGDAGYGLVFFALTMFAHLRFGKRVREKSVFVLFYILSSCAVIWGVLTGTFFGQGWIGQSVQPLIPALRDNRTLQSLCFLLGVLHLSVAHLWRAAVKLPSLRALSDIGWTLILWGAYFLAKMLILGYAFPDVAKWLLIAGALSVVLFTNPSRNVFKGIGAGFGSLILNIVNSFTDVVSYIRLFAVGLASVAIADSFNDMAVAFGYSNLLTTLVTSLILFLGHTLNILLGPLAVLVHGVRLNVLEFCTHLDVKWSGISYKPLER